MNEIGIYIHIPFCIKKCYYCDFISFANCEKKIDTYCMALLKEIEGRSINLDKKDIVTTIYIGGGTPSVINEKYIKQIINKIKLKYLVSENAEITIEVNPGTVTEEKLKMYKDAGINRLSIGLQSTKNELLKKIGRIHTYEDFLDCFNSARKVGFKNINVDLMLGLPGQTVKELMGSVTNIINLSPEHISLYSLILEENTPLKVMVEEGKIKLPDEEIEREMYWITKELLENNGYKHYEISNFAKEGFKSQHNYNCWKQKEYLGFGIAAHSYYKNKRYCNANSIDEYCENINNDIFSKNIITCEIQTEKEKQKEFMMLGLRLIEGIDIQEFKNKFVNNPIYLFSNELDKLVKNELVEVDLNNIQLTKKGLDFANLVWEEFV